MKKVIATALLALLTAKAFAQTAAPLNLDLPASEPAPSTDPADPDSPAYPGKYYGDGSDSDSLIDRTKVSGSVTSTVGYSKAYGTGFGTSADVNITTQLKNGQTVNMSVGVSRSNGLPYSPYGYGGYRYGPRY